MTKIDAKQLSEIAEEMDALTEFKINSDKYIVKKREILNHVEKVFKERNGEKQISDKYADEILESVSIARFNENVEHYFELLKSKIISLL